MKTDKCILRTGKLGDAGEILEIMKSVMDEHEFLITLSEEYDLTTQQQREWIGNFLQNERETIIVAEIHGEVVGWISFHSPDRKRMAHTGAFGMMIRKECRNMGIGKLLVQALLDWAEANPFIEKVCLGVFSTNHRAIALYKRMGFVEEGRKVNEFKLNENEYADDILMYKFV
ncbi:GNAT family N-acetyltransferase [Virgibacillus siamensis]|uniref:GNAT family N-acetyltransferase n=1 Tax=Virgibacillus siamensis TaxID=480071 RepID=UPI002481C764|nr:GNAT family N-acetyltransferase [Virgibacillus siamensis]